MNKQIFDSLAHRLHSFDQRFSVKKAVFVLFVLWTLLLTLWLFLSSVKNGGAASWDEYDRCAWAAKVWHDIRHYDFARLWDHTHQQIVWPPLHSWVTGLLFLFFGPYLAVARLVCVASFAGIAILSLAYFYRRSERVFYTAGIIAWLLFTTCAYLLQHSVSVMSEIPGLFLILLTVYLFQRCKESRMSYTKPGILLGALFLYKYNFAALTYIALAVSVFFDNRFRLKVFFQKPCLQLFGIPLLILAIWFIPHLDDKLNGFAYFAANNPDVRMPLSLESILYYPKQFPGLYFASPLVSYFSITVVLVSIIFGYRFSLSNPLLSCFLIHLLASVFHPMKDIRFVLIPLGLFFLITGEAGAFLLQKVTRQTKVILISSLTLCAFLTPYQYSLFTTPLLKQNHDYLPAVKAIADNIGNKDYAGLLVSHDLLSPPAINYFLITHLDEIPDRRGYPKHHWLNLLMFTSKETFESIPVEKRAATLQHEFFLNNTNKVITLQSTNPQTIYRYDDLFYGVHEFANLMEQLPEFAKLYEREFPHLDMVIRVYQLEDNQKEPS